MKHLKHGRIIRIGSSDALDFIMCRHYAGRKPQISQAFGWYIDDELMAVATFGKPANDKLCWGVCGREHSANVYELNRLIRLPELEYPLSEFVSGCLKELKRMDWIVISYSDTGMNHHGYIYQACNFLYTGCTKQRTDPYSGGKHARHTPCENTGIRQVRTAKHRYIYFCTGNKRLKRRWERDLKYPVLPYPKGDNGTYELGRVYHPVLVDVNRNVIEQEGVHTMRIATLRKERG